MTRDQLDTPAAVVDLDRLAANIARLQAYLAKHGIANRPHIKTHKTVEIARMQLAAGAVGITCQKLGEAEVMADAGITDIFLPYNILGRAKLERLVALARRVTLSVTADSEITVHGLGAAFAPTGLTLPVLVEFDTGLGRCGAQTPVEAAGLARTIADTKGLTFAGLMTYPHNERTDGFVAEAATRLERDGLALGRVTMGGTSGIWHAHERARIAEYRAGVYVFGDRSTLKSGAMTQDECALAVLATVVSRPTEGRAILDAGSKALSSDLLGLEGHGLILEYPEARLAALSEEHGHVDLARCDRKPRSGERVSILPNHACVVSNLFPELTAVRGERVEAVWPVAARGKMR